MPSSIWKGSISFGLLNIPVVLYAAEKSRELHFSLLDRNDYAPIRYRKINAKTGKEVAPDEIVKGYQYESGNYVLLNDADFKAANVKATQTIDIEDFVVGSEIDPLLFEKPYYLVPQKSGIKGYVLLRCALQRSQKMAVAKIVIRVRQHLCALIARGEHLILEILRFSHELKEAAELDFPRESGARTVKISPRELQMADALIEGMTTRWKPGRYRDTYYEDLLRRIEQKVQRGQRHQLSGDFGSREPQPRSAVVDLMPLLKKSLADRKKKTGGGSRKPSGNSRPARRVR